MGYRPRIVYGEVQTTYDLPMPVMSTPMRTGRVPTTFEIPLVDGVFLSRSKRGSGQLSLSGIMTVDNPQDTLRAGLAAGCISNISAEVEIMQQVLLYNALPFYLYRYIAGATLGGMEFSAAANTRYFQNCVCTELFFDWSNRTVRHLPYSFTVLVPDGVEWIYNPPA